MNRIKLFWKDSLIFARSHKIGAFAILLLCIIGLCVVGAFAKYVVTSPVTRTTNKIAKRIEKGGQKVLRIDDSPSGSKVILCQTNWITSHFAIPVFEIDNKVYCEFIGCNPGGISKNDTRYDSRIFYDEENLDSGTYLSSMTKIVTSNGTDVIILIIPNFNGAEADLLNYSYEESPQYGQTPYDTLNSSFNPVYSKSSYPYKYPAENIPMWMLVLSTSSIPKDYELHYGDYVLTYQDIQNGIWEP